VAGISRWIDTQAVGGPAGQPRFLNGVLAAEFEGSARELLSGLQAIERAHGRDRAREEHHGPRTLDLDLLLFGGKRIDEPGLTVPHPGLEERWFVLAPLAELAPDLELPGCRRTVAERLAELGARASSGRQWSAS
jgi:2-amino-4-hydroxy-6-hydroxymethyldihydropteridine diphosphokinase